MQVTDGIYIEPRPSGGTSQLLSVQNISRSYSVPESQIRGPRRHQGWLERQQAQGEAWLRTVVEHGDRFAMLSLGIRLIHGDGIPKSVVGGLGILRRAAENSYVPAKEALGVILMDLEEEWASPMEGAELLTEAINAGSVTAMSELGHRLMLGSGVETDVSKGVEFLSRAAQGGDRLAMSILARHLLLKSEGNSPEGAFWMGCAGASKPYFIPKLGTYIYSRARASITLAQRLRLSSEAAEFYAGGITTERKDPFCALNLAYLLRRGETQLSSRFSFAYLLDDLLASRNVFATVNQCLRLAVGYECEKNWAAADALFGSLSGSSGILEWWQVCAKEGEPEGHLVLGWLMRWSLTCKLDNVDLSGRLDHAKAGFPDLPNWMKTEHL